MNFAGNFTRIGAVEVGPIERKVLALTAEDWARESVRQQRDEVHRDTEFIGLVYDLDFRHRRATRRPPLAMFEPALKPIFASISAHFENSPKGRSLCERFGLGYFVRVSLLRLKPGGRITPHQDLNFSLGHSHRVHVPVITHDDVWFSVGQETLNMLPGEIWEINNRRLYSARNDGDGERVHLILDFVLPGEQCCCGEKRHPDAACTPILCLQTDRLKVPCTCYPEEVPERAVS